MADTPRILNMRPDPPDLRDRLSNPILRALEPEFNASPFDHPAWHARVKDQCATAACTGFALAAMVETLTFKCWEAHQQGEQPGAVSPFMLYYFARRYDELCGSDPEDGSTARGSMKSWHEHGVAGSSSGPAWRLITTPTQCAPFWSVSSVRRGEERIMGLHASYHPISQTTLDDFIAMWHSEDFWKKFSRFREELKVSGKEFYIGTTWHVLDFIINPPGNSIPELIYAVRGHEFPGPDGSLRLEPHLPSYDDEYWRSYTYVSAEEAIVIAQYLPLIDQSEFDSRFVPHQMKGVYRAPMPGKEDREEYLELLINFQNFYQKVANSRMAVLISIG
jgi:hypothetical protein